MAGKVTPVVRDPDAAGTKQQLIYSNLADVSKTENIRYVGSYGSDGRSRGRGLTSNE